MIAAFDFFAVPTLPFSVLYCFFVIEHGRRKILHFRAAAHSRHGLPLPPLGSASIPFMFATMQEDHRLDQLNH